MAKVEVSPREANKAKVLKALRKRDKKTAHDFARELGVVRQALTLPIRDLVAEGKAVRHAGSPPSYTKA